LSAFQLIQSSYKLITLFADRQSVLGGALVSSLRYGCFGDKSMDSRCFGLILEVGELLFEHAEFSLRMSDLFAISAKLPFHGLDWHGVKKPSQK
jgi:hypothetical protein